MQTQIRLRGLVIGWLVAILAIGGLAVALSGREEPGKGSIQSVRQDIVQLKDFLTLNPKYLEGVRSSITSSGFSCPQIVHLWATGDTRLGPKLEAFCDATDPNASHYAYYPNDHSATAWSDAEDFEKRWAKAADEAYAKAENETKKRQRHLCQVASACNKYNQARVDCATAGNLKSCMLIKLGDNSRYADLCSSGEIGAPALPPSPDTPNAAKCFLLELGLY
jgi:hypothetical protein